jgi:hypothetical protein
VYEATDRSEGQQKATVTDQVVGALRYRQHGATVLDLVDATGLTDREVRDSVARLRSEGRLQVTGEGLKRYHLVADESLQADVGRRTSPTLPSPASDAPRPAGQQGAMPLPDVVHGEAAPVWVSAASADRRFVGDTLIGGRPLGRILDAACYWLAGIALIVLGVSTSTFLGVLLGLATGGYGVAIYVGTGPYWVNSLVYLLAFFTALGALARVFA